MAGWLLTTAFGNAFVLAIVQIEGLVFPHGRDEDSPKPEHLQMLEFFFFASLMLLFTIVFGIGWAVLGLVFIHSLLLLCGRCWCACCSFRCCSPSFLFFFFFFFFLIVAVSICEISLLVSWIWQLSWTETTVIIPHNPSVSSMKLVRHQTTKSSMINWLVISNLILHSALSSFVFQVDMPALCLGSTAVMNKRIE